MRTMYDCILDEIKACFTDEGRPLITFASFDEFWQEVDIINSYEPAWPKQKDKLKKHYERAFNEIRHAEDNT